MQERTVVVVLLVCSSYFRLAKASSIACEATGAGASCELWNGRPGCDGDRISNEQEIESCWPSSLHVSSVHLESFSITKTIGSCPSTPSLNYGNCVSEVDTHERSGAHHQVQHLEIGYKPVNVFRYNITVRWTYQDSNPSPVGVQAYRLLLTGGGLETMEPPFLCVCINSSLDLTEYSFTVDYRYGPSSPLVANMFTLPHNRGVTDDDPYQTETSSEVPATCADYKTGLAYGNSTCGLPLYGRPRNVTMEQRGTSTELSWGKPCFKSNGACDLYGHGLFYANPEIYYLTLTDNEVKHYFRVSNATEVRLNTSTGLHVKVFAYVPCSGLYEYRNTSTGYGNGCSLPGEVGDGDKLDEATCCSFLSMPTSTSIFNPTPSPTLSTTSSPSQVYALISATVVAVVLILIVTTTLCAIIWYRKKPPPPSPPSPPTPELEPIVSALIIFSPRTPQLETQAIMHSLVTVLRYPFGIESQIPELNLPRDNLFDWITEHHQKAQAVFCVCNRYFYEEWNQTANLENHLKVVYCFKTLFEGFIDSDKYAVVLTDSNDRVYIPPLLKSRRTFNINDYEGIAHFARNIPRFSRHIPAATTP